MPEQDKKEGLHSGTVEEQDSQEYDAKIADLEVLKREKQGLPSEPVTIDGQVIPPILSLFETKDDTDAQKDVSLSLPIEISHGYHIRLVRENVIAARGLDEPKKVIKELKKAA